MMMELVLANYGDDDSIGSPVSWKLTSLAEFTVAEEMVGDITVYIER